MRDDDCSWRSTPAIVGQLGNLRPDGQSAWCVFLPKRRRLPTAVQDTVLPHTISIIDSILDALH
jgi:hypothetical protein